MANEFRKVTDQNGVDHPVTDDARVTWAANGVLGAKNLMINEGKNETISGVTFTVNEDGSVTANGTASADVFYSIVLRASGLPLKGLKHGVEYILSGDNSPSTDSYVFVNYFVDSTLSGGTNTNNGEVKFTIPNDKTYISYGICIKSGKTVTNKTFYPMIRLATDTDSTYVPYAMTNRELTGKTLILKGTYASVDLNTLTESGLYKMNGSLTHNPDSSNYGWLQVLYSDSNNITQIYYPVSTSGAMYTRRYHNAAWQNWFKFTGTELT